MQWPFGACRTSPDPPNLAWVKEPLCRRQANIPFSHSCHSGYVGVRCEHADLLAVVAASQKKQAITALVVVSIVALAVLIVTCVLIQ